MTGITDDSLNTIRQNIDDIYKNLIPIANEIVSKCTKASDDIIEDIRLNINELSNDKVRDYILKISLVGYSFSEIKEKSMFKSEIAEMVRKEKYAVEYNAASGAVAARDNEATLNSSDEKVIEMIYSLVASELKVKLDELHRIVDSLKTVLTSRLSEAKITQMGAGLGE